MQKPKARPIGWGASHVCISSFLWITAKSHAEDFGESPTNSISRKVGVAVLQLNLRSRAEVKDLLSWLPNPRASAIIEE
jgi:hypothetical protein